MPSSIVRQSKFRHVFGKPVKKELEYTNLKPTGDSWDTDKLTANGKYIGVIWQTIGGGAFAVIPKEKTGKALNNPPLVNGHQSAILDLKFSPFGNDIIASASEDCTAKVWKIQNNGGEVTGDCVANLTAHRRKVGGLEWNPVANNVLATSSGDYTVKLWDVEAEQEQVSIGAHSSVIQSMSWNYAGSLLATSSKDKKLRLFDARADSCVLEAAAHTGPKGFRVVNLGELGLIATVGFGRGSERQLWVWDQRKGDKPVEQKAIDISSGMLMPFYDNDTSILYLAGKGDGNIRYFEMVDEAPYQFSLSQYTSQSPQRGMCMVPKTDMNTDDCEIARLLKLTKDAVQPISFIVPRRSAHFQDDLYPPTASDQPAVSSADWFAGTSVNGPVKVSMSGDGSKTAAVKVSSNANKKSSAGSNPKVQKLEERVAELEAQLKEKDALIADLQQQVRAG